MGKMGIIIITHNFDDRKKIDIKRKYITIKNEIST
jgi:hypothetical protein